MSEEKLPREVICGCGNNFKTFSYVRKKCYKCDPIRKNHKKTEKEY